jgi:hypothetical protein
MSRLEAEIVSGTGSLNQAVRRNRYYALVARAHTAAGVNKLPIEDFEDMSLVYSTVTMRAQIKNAMLHSGTSYSNATPSSAALPRAGGLHDFTGVGSR